MAVLECKALALLQVNINVYLPVFILLFQRSVKKFEKMLDFWKKDSIFLLKKCERDGKQPLFEKCGWAMGRNKKQQKVSEARGI